MTALSALLHLAAGLAGPSWTGLITEGVDGALAVLGIVGVVALVRDTTGRPAVAAWNGTSTVFAWGVYSAALTLGGTPLASAGHPLTGLAALTGVLGGFALAVAGLLAVSARR